MKKKFYMVLFLAMSIVLPMSVSAKEVDLEIYPKEELSETLVAESLTLNNISNYKPDNNSVNVYVFRKDGCVNCKNFYQYVLDEILLTHGNKINIITFEVSNNPINSNLAIDIQVARGEQDGTQSYYTPYIVIGNKSFSGNMLDKKEEVKAAIDEAYNSGNYYDVFEDLNGKTKVFNDNEVSFISSKALDKSYSLKTTLIDKSNVLLDGYKYIKAYDISMYNGATIVPLSNGNYEISIPITENYPEYQVAYLENDKVVEKLNATVKNGKITFITTHLSEYAIYGKSTENVSNDTIKEPDNNTNVEENVVKKPTNNAQTSDNSILYISMFLISAIGLGIIFKTKKKAE